MSDARGDWLTIDDARAIAKVSAKLLYREIRLGRLKAARLGGRRLVRIHRDWLQQWMVAAAEPAPVLVKGRAS